MNWRGAKWSGHPTEECFYNYTNTSLFPNMTRFLDFEHARGVRGYLNDHPCKCNERQPRPQQCAGGKNPEPTSPAEVQFRWDGLTAMLEKGIDFWW
jgi:hypothetical protein